MIRQNTWRMARGIATLGFFVSVAALENEKHHLSDKPTEMLRTGKCSKNNSHCDGLNSGVKGGAEDEDRSHAPEPIYKCTWVSPVPKTNCISPFNATSRVSNDGTLVSKGNAARTNLEGALGENYTIAKM